MTYGFYKLAGFLATPGNLLLIAFLIGSVLLWNRRFHRTGRFVVTVTAVLFLLIAYSPIAPLALGLLEDRFPGEPPLPGHIDGIILLGGAVEQNISLARNQPTVKSAAGRIIETVRLANRHPEARIVVSGGSADPFRPQSKEAVVMAQLLADLGVAPDRIIQEDQSRTTYENAILSREIVKPQPGQNWILVTSARHIPRSVGVFRRVGWPVIAWPSDYRTGGGFEWTNVDMPEKRLATLFDALHEWGGLVSYRLAGWTNELFPGP